MGADRRPAGHPALRAGDHPLRSRGGGHRARHRRALPNAHARRLGRRRRADRGRGVRRGPRHRLDFHYRHRSARALAGQGGIKWLHAGIPATQLRLAGRGCGSGDRQVVGPAGARAPAHGPQTSESGTGGRTSGAGPGQRSGGHVDPRGGVAEDHARRRDHPADPPRQAGPHGGHAGAVGPRPGRWVHRRRADVALRARRDRRPRHAHLRRDRPAHQRARARARRPRREGGRRRRDHVPQPPRLRGGDGGRGEARCPRALSEHGLRRAPAGRGREAREAGRARVRSGVHRPARGRRHPAQALHRMGRQRGRRGRPHARPADRGLAHRAAGAAGGDRQGDHPHERHDRYAQGRQPSVADLARSRGVLPVEDPSQAGPGERDRRAAVPLVGVRAFHHGDAARLDAGAHAQVRSGDHARADRPRAGGFAGGRARDDVRGFSSSTTR